ncbi:MAG: hypothetical protein ACYDHP_05060 [Ferrimicrobium sp.]
METAARRLRLLSFWTMVTLAVELLLGVATNLWVTLPSSNPWNGANPAWLMYAHAVVGLALLGNAVMVLSRAWESNVSGAVLWGIVGLVGILIAIVAGASFVVVGGTSNLMSFAMAVGFAASIVAYARIQQIVESLGAVDGSKDMAR